MCEQCEDFGSIVAAASRFDASVSHVHVYNLNSLYTRVSRTRRVLKISQNYLHICDVGVAKC